jgi:HEAT repeats
MDSSEGQTSVQPTPDYGSLGPSSDLAGKDPITPQPGTWRILAALLLGALLAVPFGTGRMRGAWAGLSKLLRSQGGVERGSSSASSDRQVSRTRPQHQAELLLQQAINGDVSANDLIASGVDGWHGRLQLTPKLNSLIDTALNAGDLRVRVSGIEVDLAAVAVAKTPESADQLMQQAASGPQNQRVWALWTLGLLANRGIERERVSQFLIEQLQDSNPEIRRWTVEGLSYVGSDETIEPLLRTLHSDSSPNVRERAACALAQSGMLSHEQRQTVVPTLLNFAEDSALDRPTHAWVYHALRDITAQSLPDDVAAWRSWYNAKQN